MYRIAIATLPEPGHINPFVGTARALQELGCEVGWYTLPTCKSPLLRANIEATGATLLPTPDYEFPAWAEELLAGLDPNALKRDRRALVQVGMELCGRVEQLQVEPFRQLLHEFGADAAVVDPLCWSTGIAAQLESIPYIGACTNLEFALPEGVDRQIDAWGFDASRLQHFMQKRAALFASFGLQPTFATHNPFSPWTNTVFATSAFIGPHLRSQPTVTLVGPSLRPEDMLKEAATDFDMQQIDPERALVPVSFGTQVYCQPERIRIIAAAAADLPVQLVISAGTLADDTAFTASLAGDPILVPTMPQRKLLSQATAFVTHGGGNSVMEALMVGVPMLVSPIDIDQPIQAFFIENSGAGITLDLSHTSAQQCQEALTRLTAADSDFRRKARDIADSFRQNDGAKELANIALSLASAAD